MPNSPAASGTAELSELMHARSRTYGMLSRLFLKEVDEETLRELQGMRFPRATGNAKIDEGYHQIYELSLIHI